jgi:hypothetical protein
MLFNFDPPATAEEIHDASLQFVRKLSGYQKPSKENEQAFNHAVESISHNVTTLLGSLTTTATHKNRERETAKRHARSAKRFGINV